MNNKSKRPPFYKKLREYQLFEVQRVPYIDYINDYISYFKDKQAKNEKLLYFKNLKKIANLSRLSDYGVWLICIILAITYSLTSENYG